MADQGRWFKLWCSVLGDPALANLSLADFGRWCKLGALVKLHGEGGTIALTPPGRLLCAIFGVDSFPEAMETICRLPGVVVATGPIFWPHGRHRPPESEGRILAGAWQTDGRGSHPASAAVATPVTRAVLSGLFETGTAVTCHLSFRNWPKYQADLSTPRVQASRYEQAEMKRSKKRREEKLDSSVSSSTASDSSEARRRPLRRNTTADFTGGFLAFWAKYPKKVGKDKSAQRWRDKGCETITEEVLAGLERTRTYLTREGGQFIPNPDTWLNQGRWRDEPPSLPGVMPRTAGNLDAARQAIEEHKRATEGRA